MVAVNLLPWRQRRQQQQRRQSLVVLSLMLSAVLVGVMQQSWRICQASEQVAQTGRVRASQSAQASHFPCRPGNLLI